MTRTAGKAVSRARIFDVESARARAARVLSDAWSVRRDDAWIGLVAAPLAMTASALMNDWYLWPELLVCSAVATRAWKWSWVLALEMGLAGTAWAFVGAHALAEFPAQRGLVGAVWAGFAAVLAVASAMNRHRL